MDCVQLDEKRAEAFADRMVGVLNGGALALMTSIGHRTRLFDAMATLPPSTSARIAEAANLNERYVREWLGAMVTGGIVEYDHDAGTYSLPPEHAACLTRPAATDNIATFMQYLAVLGRVEDDVTRCFTEGGGVPYSKYPRFHEVIAEDSGLTVLHKLIDTILPVAPGMIEGLRAGIDVLDVGCGSGKAIIHMADNFPNSRFTGYDFSQEAISAAQRETKDKQVSNARFEIRDVAVLSEREQFDLITAFDAIHDQASPATVLKKIAGALRPTGTFLMQDIAGSSHVHKNLNHPIAPFLYAISCMHCMTVSLAQGGEGLGTMWGRELAERMLKEAGFTKVEVTKLPHDFQNYYYVATKT